MIKTSYIVNINVNKAKLLLLQLVVDTYSLWHCMFRFIAHISIRNGWGSPNI